ncbi:hypothetical protein GOP47_0003890 [Adiantum capillus-veneris]|uniref:Uncharacterized protein n=1 Tax=Adiantum capillus-veneris TaxID=13818 RepID=A0A9D4ZP00_ADICA|nr:hypothetical protein GOP47_0003890 [Adiantum capillus-veneris]
MEQADGDVPSSSQTTAGGEGDVPPRMQHLFVMRHGDRLDDADHNWIFKAPRPWDPPLTDMGKHRARRVGRSLRHQGWNITRVVCSPFLRCIQTASEVITGLCSLDPFDDDSTEVAIDPSKVKVSIEYGLCEVMNSYAIRVPQMPPTGPTTLDLEDLEVLLPAGTVDATVPKIMAKLPDWRETLDASYKRYVDTFQAIADMFPGENILCVTHGEGVSVSVTQHHNVTVYQVRYLNVVFKMAMFVYCLKGQRHQSYTEISHGVIKHSLALLGLNAVGQVNV